MKHGNLIAGKTIKGQFLVNITILGLDGIEHECLERFILDRDMLIAIPAEHIGYIVIFITQDQILVCQQAEDVRGWVIIQFYMFLLSRHDLFVAGICICWQDIGSAAHIQVKNIVGDEFAADIIRAECDGRCAIKRIGHMFCCGTNLRVCSIRCDWLTDCNGRINRPCWSYTDFIAFILDRVDARLTVFVQQFCHTAGTIANTFIFGATGFD